MVGSRYTGVDCLKGRKWGARIAIDGKRIWLGTHDSEEEAAVAYDRVNLKIDRYGALNFPGSIMTAQEIEFQGEYSLEQIISMIKDKSYLPRFRAFILRLSLLAQINSGNWDNSVGHMGFHHLIYGNGSNPPQAATKGFRLFGVQIN
ncbi:hypothetical protein Nepgr_024630 [Nepenthes gracilis]|uniref:AP2/ERF domain-containing protein n=1 Tax=Nepenthes gracilis TaxID=150966 RepID=A0AAD3T6A0_NEPGR|nr:hypothetical protein Nepgr_024630 [Nepenthes gracilis]